MRVEDGGASFSLIVCEQSLTAEALDRLKSLDGVDRVLTGDNAFTVVFRVDSFLDITPLAVINAQQAIKRALRAMIRISCPGDSVSMGI